MNIEIGTSVYTTTTDSFGRERNEMKRNIPFFEKGRLYGLREWSFEDGIAANGLYRYEGTETFMTLDEEPYVAHVMQCVDPGYQDDEPDYHQSLNPSDWIKQI